MSIYVAPRPKAVTGVGAAAMETQPYLSGSGRWLGHEQKFMKQCTAMWKNDPWIRTAERVISGKFSTVDWHLEDADDVEVDDAYPDKRYLQPRDLLERPQKNLAPDQSQGLTRREMWNLTSRHMGVTGNAFWYLDQLESQARTPLDILYIAPWRMWPVPDSNGNLVAWMLDYNENSRTGTRLELEEVIHFTLEPPEEGFFGIGLVESAMKLVAMDAATLSHATTTLGSGGRLAGIVSPKDAASAIPDDKYDQIVRDFRTISELPDAAKRTIILKGPIDFTPTSANMTELGVTDLLTLSRDFVASMWGVPLSQMGVSTASGLNSGDTKKFDEAALWQNAIHPRLVALDEGIQYGLLDRYEKLGIVVEMEIEEPAFDDDGPRYDLLEKSAGIAMRNVERRALINLEPLGDAAMDNAVWLPSMVSEAFIAPDENGNLIAQPEVLPAPPLPQITAGPVVSIAKASLPPKVARLHGNLTAFRARIDRDVTPHLKADLAAFLERQRSDIATRLRINGKPRDVDGWFTGARWDRELASLLERPLRTVAQGVAGHVDSAVRAKADVAFGPGGAAPALTVERVLLRGAARIKAINERTREAVRAFIIEALKEGLSPAELADRIEAGVKLDNGAPAFDELRAETIARTELMDAYNAANLGSYLDAGLTEVQAIDGDQDEECAQRDGQVFTIEEASTIEDHPNGTLDWVPVIAEPQAKSELDHAYEVMRALAERVDPAPRISVEGPTIHNHPPLVPDILVPETVVNLPEPKARRIRKVVERDETGRIVAIVEEDA